MKGIKLGTLLALLIFPQTGWTEPSVARRWLGVAPAGIAGPRAAATTASTQTQAVAALASGEPEQND